MLREVREPFEIVQLDVALQRTDSQGEARVVEGAKHEGPEAQGRVPQTS